MEKLLVEREQLKWIINSMYGAYGTPDSFTKSELSKLIERRTQINIKIYIRKNRVTKIKRILNGR